MSAENPSDLQTGDLVIELKGISKTFLEGNKERTVFKDLNYSFSDGEIAILFGRSGSGKSTLLNLISGIDLPVKGEIVIAGNNLTGMSEQERTVFRRKHIGFIFQFFNLIPTLTVIENLQLPLELNGRTDKEDRRYAMGLLEEVGLKDRADSYPDRLSGGEQQRIAIARALVHEPAIILADEPTGNLDYETGLQIIDLLDRLVKQKGKTMIMATHSREVIGLADKIITVKDGSLTEVPPENIKQ